MVIGDVEHAFVVSSGPDRDGRSTIAVLDRALFRRALDLFGRLGIEPASATPEPLVLAASPGTWRLRLGDAYGCLRMSGRLGIACSPSGRAEPPVELRLALEQAGTARPGAIEVEGDCDTAAWTASLGVKVTEVAADRSRAAPAVLELLQYEHAPRLADWRAWRAPAALAAALAVDNLEFERGIGAQLGQRAQPDAHGRHTASRSHTISIRLPSRLSRARERKRARW